MEHSGDMWLGLVVFCAFGVVVIGALVTVLVLLARQHKPVNEDQVRAFPVIPKSNSSSKSD